MTFKERMRYDDMCAASLVHSCWSFVSPTALAVIRTVLVLYQFLAWCFEWRAWSRKEEPEELRFFTNISYLLLFFTLFALMTLSWLFVLSRSGKLKFRVPHVVTTTVWTMWELMCPTAVYVTIIYWSFIWPYLDQQITMLTVNVHIVNSILVLIEYSVNRIQFLAFHFWVTWMVVSLY